MLRKYSQFRFMYTTHYNQSNKHKKNFKPLRNLDPEDGSRDIESDFMNIDKTHRQHEEEIKLLREQNRHHLVKQKYFRQPKLPNFLLYAEKEQIRSLHAQDPHEWNIDRLAESFPATEEIVKKILKSKWRPYSIKRIKIHDEVVEQNWKRLMNNDIVLINEETRTHLKKFQSREKQQSNDLDDEIIKQHYLPKAPEPKSKEYVSIIEKCKKNCITSSYHTIGSKSVLNEEISKYQEQNMKMLASEKKKNMRWEDLKNNLALKSNPIIQEEQKNLYLNKDDNSFSSYIKKFEETDIVISDTDKKKYEISIYKDRIHIPRKLWRKGSTYRVEDCYFDDDGEFLYRIPGMINNRT